jgi:undecaprenyl diphosphate synthase
MDELDDIDPARMPRHVAVIMDGNGRWAVTRGRERVAGHERGAESVRRIVTDAARLHDRFSVPTHLTLYSFSIENWSRPVEEVSFLMQMYIRYLRQERETMMRNNIRFAQIGRLDHLPDEVLDEVQATLDETAGNTGMVLTLALNYGSRTEITDAVRAIAAKVASGTMTPGEIDESVVNDHLYTRGYPDVDLLIRTAGEMRISNYLLWQISYAELHVTDVLWPDFDESELRRAVRVFSCRKRRFGGLEASNTLPAGQAARS